MSIHQYSAGPVIPSTQRARPQIANQTLRTDTGRLLRGATMDIRKQATPPCNQQSVWDSYRSAGINLVRLDVKTDTDGAGRPIAQQLPFLDGAVDCAARAHMYIMPGVSIAPGNYNLAQLTAFWTAVAPRYKDRAHVIYEMTNEPVSGSPYWGAANQWTDAKLRDLRSVHDIMRSNAPNTHIAAFSTPNLYPDAPTWRPVPQRYSSLGSSPLVWDNVSIAYHHYLGTYNFGAPNGFGGINLMKSYGYNVIMTECNDFMNDAPSNDPRNKQQVWLWSEQNNISWVCLDGKGGTISQQITSEIMPYLAANGFGLPVE